MHGDMVRFVAFDFILRIVWAGVMRMPLVVNRLGVDFDNPAADTPGFRIPRNVIADFELLFQSHSPYRPAAKSGSLGSGDPKTD
jgi:hypothetical protein